jgi:hypothetical protein
LENGHKYKAKIDLKRYIPTKGKKSYLIKFVIYTLILLALCLYFLNKLDQVKSKNSNPETILKKHIDLEIEQ